MKTERENYLKPQTIMEQVAMEQGICAGSVMADTESGVIATKHETGFDGRFDSDPNKSNFDMGTWN